MEVRNPWALYVIKESISILMLLHNAKQNYKLTNQLGSVLQGSFHQEPGARGSYDWEYFQKFSKIKLARKRKYFRMSSNGTEKQKELHIKWDKDQRKHTTMMYL